MWLWLSAAWTCETLELTRTCIVPHVVAMSPYVSSFCTVSKGVSFSLKCTAREAVAILAPAMLVYICRREW
uniref:Hypothetical secreted protein 122 n=1 Tax=Amblyomma variegatum TaxID=34610 RepID=F0J9U0_AMBVA|nr:TPA_inf: hypothetical secreted protein 122 [Amblyomma variegatum]